MNDLFKWTDSSTNHPPPIKTRTIKYGSRYWQTVSFVSALGRKNAPLIVVLDGAPWPSPTHEYPISWLNYRLMREGYAVAQVNYDTVERKMDSILSDIVGAIAVLRGRSAELQIDANQIVLIGVRGGAHIATLLGTDDAFFARGGVPFSTLAAVVSINGDGFNMPKRITSAGRFRAKGYEKIFGTDRAEQLRFSPIDHLSPPNAPHFLFFVAGSERESVAQSSEIADALSNAQTKAELMILPKWRENMLSTYFVAEKGESGEEFIEFLSMVTRQH